MGCVPSKTRRRKTEADAAARGAAAAAAADEEKRAAAALAAAARGADRQEDASSKIRSMPRPQSRVERQTSMYEQLDQAARAPPELRTVASVEMGEKSKKLLDNFEEKERAAHAKPELVAVDKNDLRCSDVFTKMLGDYEENDAKAAAEPKLEKTFVQKEKESVERIIALSAAASTATETSVY